MWACPKCGEKIEDQFDSCWKCAAKTEQTDSAVRRLSWSFFVMAAVMALLAPAVADCLHSFFVVRSGIRFYNAELGRIAQPVFWILLGIRVVITFLALWFFGRIGFRDIFVWCVCVVLWTLLDMQMEIAIG